MKIYIYIYEITKLENIGYKEKILMRENLVEIDSPLFNKEKKSKKF